MSHKIHTLRRVRGSKTIYQCVDPTCTWREHKQFLSGKLAICFRCNSEYLLDAYALQLSRPHCATCTRGEKGKQAPNDVEGQKLLEKLGIAS